jgi:hypothetical protein
MTAARALAASLIAACAGFVGGHLWEQNRSHWSCGAEDEVVVIDDTCRHVDTLGRTP